MAQWVTVAEGVSIWDLEQTVADMELPKGTKIRVEMDTWMPWLFDIAGAELVFQSFVPDGLDLIDVYGKGGKGIVDMEADPAWLVPVLAFMKAHWVTLIIAGIVLWTIISFIRVMVDVPALVAAPVWLLIGAAAAIAGLVILGARSPPARSRV